MPASLCRFTLLAACLLLAAGCESVSSRARAHAQVFAALGAQDQARLLAGDVAIGDTPAMVLIALGKPPHDDAFPISNGSMRRTWTYTEDRYLKESSRVSRTEERRGQAVVEDVYRVLHVITAQVVFLDDRVISVRQPGQEAREFAALATAAASTHSR